MFAEISRVLGDLKIQGIGFAIALCGHFLVQQAVFWYILGQKSYRLNKLLAGEKICPMQLTRLS